MKKINIQLFYAVMIFMLIYLIGGCSNINQESKEQQSNLIKTTIDTLPKVTGIGGVFFKSGNPKKTKEWYKQNLGLTMDAYGSVFETRNINNPDEINYLRWSLFDENTTYFDPSKKEFMVNYRVQNIEGLVRKLKANGVTVVDSVETYEYGKFVHLLDIDGNKLELWEPNNSFLSKRKDDGN